ncbi:alkaline phosphatase family protein [Limisphaera sp. 4302-co]|uniref:alkaline phosphatase family protein n=1 Tax=Limisphaera sp. 4302-co TaxID=3400417 RepID=UPI003C1CBB17
MERFTRSWSSLVFWLWGTLALAWADPRVAHVVIVSMDGAAPWVLRHTSMPVLHQLYREGAATWDAETIRPPVTLPSHTSMLTGVHPSRHRITWNDWRPTNGVVRVPTIFAAAKRAGLTTAMFVGKEKLQHLFQPGTVDHFDYGGEVLAGARISPDGTAGEDCYTTVPDESRRARSVARRAAAYIRQNRPNLCFIHLADPDVVGHKHGWGSPEQRRCLQDVDAALNEILGAIRRAGLRRNTVLIVTADHGGHGKGHSSDVPENVRIPWIAWGADVRNGTELNEPISTCDTAATALWLLDVPSPGPLDGRPVRVAFRHP